MAKLGFHENWILLVMRCLSSVTYAVRVNGHACGHIVPTRGLRQGDPLSPYLFLICAKGLSALLHKAVRNKELKGVAASARRPRISHLFFADDSLIFGRATVKECSEIQRVLQVYEESSGQQLNRNKTSLFFSHNTANGVKETIKAMFGAQIIKSHESYLGLPSLIGRSKRNTFAQLKQRVSNKLAGWKEKLLSSAGKEVLIKAVAQAIPSYTMSCFKLPNTLCDELTGMVRQFWWGQVKDEKKLAWMSWEKMCLPKEKGGMGFRDLKLFNLALLAKQGWRLQTNSSSLFYRVYKAKYFPSCDFIEACLGSQPSFAWRSIWAAQDIVKRGLRWQVGDGEKIQVWKDKWLQQPSTYRVVTPMSSSQLVVMVCDLIDGDRKEWKEDLIRQCFFPQDVEAILSIPLSAHGARDRMIWAENKNGKFTVRSAYKLAQEIHSDGNTSESSDRAALKQMWRRLWGQRDLVLKQAGHPIWDQPNVDIYGCDVAVTKVDRIIPGVGGACYSNMLGIWKERNIAIHGGRRREGKAIVRSSLRVLDEFQLANVRLPAPTRQLSNEIKWSPPQLGHYKVNVDRAVFSKRKQVGIGVIIRDSGGMVIAALSRKLAFPLGALETEAKAMEVGVQFALDVGVRDVTLEGDSICICNALQGLGEASFSVQNIVAGTLHLAKGFRTVAFSYTKRLGNVPAHLLAQYAANVENYDCMA
ncbi:uncharacterized protein LOC136071439 [Quercus suber]|uniref:uncharacterized protein LOC136071439 n=1 Tax=Quercus suber TaxID=58331 RepID=UPI0032E03AC7